MNPCIIQNPPIIPFNFLVQPICFGRLRQGFGCGARPIPVYVPTGVALSRNLSHCRKMSSDDDTSISSTASPSSTQTEYGSSSAGSSTHSVPPEHNYETAAPPPDRTDLLDTARVFLSSAQIQAQSENTRREFLLKKGLSNAEIDYLLQSVVSVFFFFCPFVDI